MINRTRMLLDDLDSEGFPIPYPREFAALAAVNIGRIADHAMVQAILADHKCLSCFPSVEPPLPPDYTIAERRSLAHMSENPKGWDEVDGVLLPPITWAEEAKQLVDDADAKMDQFVGKAAADHFRAYFDGVKRLSDSTAPEAFVGRKV